MVSRVKFIISGIFLLLRNVNPADLYSSRDPIVQLNVSNFYSTVLNQNHAWLIEFYSSWCGHCINFAPLFVHLAQAVEGWKRVIQVGAVNCGDDVNLPICRQYEITGYPTLKFYKPYVNASDLGIKYLGRKRIEIIQRNMVDFITSIQNERLFANNWPSFNLPEYMFLQFSTIKHIILKFRNASLIEMFAEHGVSKLGLVFDNQTLIPYWLKEAILDLHHPETYPPILRVASDRQDMIDTFKITQFPSLALVEPSGQYQLYELEPSRESFVNLMKKLFKEPETTTVVSTNDHGDTTELTTEHSFPDSSIVRGKDQVYAGDLEGAIKYAFRHEVSQHKVIGGNQLHALKSFVHVLDDYFPGRASMRTAIRRLKTSLQLVVNEIRGEDFATLWSDALRGSDVEVEWVGCLGSKPHLRGYPCSLWVTFHTLTVNHALTYPGTSLDAPNRVLIVMKEFIKHFFGCAHCATHFVAMAEDTANPIESVKTPKEEVLWLWTAHNKVNRRIAKSLSEDPTAPKMQFPSSKYCPSCRSGESFDDEAVFKYLVDLYSPEAISLDKVETTSVVSSGSGRPLPFELQALSLFFEMLFSIIQLPIY